MTAVAATLTIELIEEAIAIAKEVSAAEQADAAALTAQLEATLNALRAARAQTHANADARLAATQKAISDAFAAAAAKK